MSEGGASDFNMGQDMGDVASMVVGTAMVSGGSSAATGGTLVTVGSGGVLGEVGIPVAVVGTAVAAEGTILGVSGAASFGSQKGRLNAEGKYSNLKEPRNVGDGKKTPAQRQRILEENKKQNGGQLKSDGDGRPLNQPQQAKKGQKVDMNQAEVDHVKRKADGGSNSNSNLQVLSKEENLKKH